jgi:alpha-glucosidase
LLSVQPWSDADAPAAERRTETSEPGEVAILEPPEQGFFSKLLDYDGIPIKAHADVADEALHQARQRLAMMLDKLPEVRAQLRRARAELHIIGQNQVTSDLPEHRHLKGKPFEGTQTVDERTRGLGGRLTSCGEENLLRLKRDRYRGRDICVHEFAHNIYTHGMSAEMRQTFREQRRRSLAHGLWVGSYAGSNPDEFFAELSMWYWGTRGDLGMQGPKPGAGRDALRAYDPEACALLDQFYQPAGADGGRTAPSPPRVAPDSGSSE